jgi:hypothetical protein
MPMLHRFLFLLMAGLLCAAAPAGEASAAATKPWNAPDLNLVSFDAAPRHDPIILIDNGQSRANLCLMGDVDADAVTELQKCIRLTTGASLPVVKNQIKEPALIIGDCPEARAQLTGQIDRSAESFAIRTAPNRVYLINTDPHSGIGQTWAIYEFLERYVGIRWYFPTDIGRSAPHLDKLIVPPVSLHDHPFFRKRELWPALADEHRDMRPLHRALRSYDSWPIKLVVHHPNWSGIEDYKKNRPEVFQLNQHGQRDWDMLCYSNPRTLETYLENIQKKIDGDPTASIGMEGNAITVSPNDAEIACFCPDCRRLWDAKAGQYGSASKILGNFVVKLAREVQKRWPDKVIIYLPYLNYTNAPDGIEFPANVHVQICGMPGMALYKEPSIFASEQANIDKWFALTHKKVQNWLYICWPEDRTTAPFLYPHIVQKYYQENRNKTVGSFINGGTDHWPRQGVTLYCWLKLLWNPDFKVDVAIDEYCRRMYGPASASMHRLVQLQIDGWENSRFPNATMSDRAILAHAYTTSVCQQMKDALAEAKRQAAGDDLVLKRIAYYETPFKPFLAEVGDADSLPRTSLIARRIGQEPTIDGKLDEEVWSRAQAVPFVRAYDRKIKDPKYPTSLKAIWTPRGVTFGFTMSDPTPNLIAHSRTGRDNEQLWWDDCVEILLDPTAKNQGDFYHFIVSAGGQVIDSHADDRAWNAAGIQTAAAITPGGWTLEVFIPFDDFAGAVKPAPGIGAQWLGNFTRHRVADTQLKNHPAESEEDYQRLNTTYAHASANLADFGPILFRD